MRFQVPQNLDIPDTIFLGLDFRQLLYIGGSVGFLVFLLIFGGGFITAALFGVPVIAFALLLSFFTLHKRPFTIILQSVFAFLLNKKIYIWKQEGSDGYAKRKIQRDDGVEAGGGSDSDRVKKLSADLMFDDTIQEDEFNIYL